MTDEFGCLFSDAAFPVYVPDDGQADIGQLFELERDRLLRDYPLEHPEYDLVFVQFIYAEESMKDPEYELDVERLLKKYAHMEKENGKILLGFILFRAYSR